jgi:glycosyltransferase involved in cell wall biosynthesis
VAGEVVEAFGPDPGRVRVVPPGVPPLPDIAGPAARAVMERVLPPGVQRYVLAVGTAEPRKDLPGLVRAFDGLAGRHGDVALVLAGPPGWGEEALSAAIDRARARARVVRTGWLEPTALAALLRGAAVLAFPSLYEGFGFPPLEAMVDVGDSEGLAGALERVLDDQVLRQELVATGTARAASFSWERCGDGLAKLYGDVAAGGGPGG